MKTERQTVSRVCRSCREDFDAWEDQDVWWCPGCRESQSVVTRHGYRARFVSRPVEHNPDDGPCDGKRGTQVKRGMRCNTKKQED